MNKLIRKDQFTITEMRDRKYFVTYEPDYSGIIMIGVVNNYLLVESVLTDDDPCLYSLMHLAQEVRSCGLVVQKEKDYIIYELKMALIKA
jgi:hypothetical protein